MSHTLCKRLNLTRQQAWQDINTGFQHGKNSANLLQQWTKVVDNLLGLAWKAQGLASDDSVSLIAIGGYGRKELFPASDIDVLILSKTELSEQQQHAVAQFLQCAWDANLSLSHSVRSYTQCIEHMQHDITAYTALLETRLLSGKPNIYENLLLKTMGESIWSKQDFITAKLAEHADRFKKYSAGSYKLEPSVKNSAGGLRHIHLIDWLAIKCLHTNDLKNLADNFGLSQQEYYQLTSARYFLWTVRLALHLHCKRNEDRLLFDYQYAIAEQLGYKKNTRENTIEAFMQDFYCNLRIISINCRQFIKWLRENYLFEPSQAQETIINSDFKILNQLLTAHSPQLFQHKPTAILELFYYHAKYNCQGIRADTVRQLRQQRDLINEHYRKQRRHQQLFLKLLQQPHNVAHTLRLMSELDVLSAYVPAFNNTIGRMQYDLFHAYTVDHHTLLLINYLERFGDQDNAERYPLAHHIFQQWQNRDVLYLAALFHDIAKGLNGDHSSIGEQLAREFCQLHQQSSAETDLICWLVKHHLLLSTTAQRRDISDTDIIAAFAKKVKHRHYLDALYVLTVADIRATNEKLWTSWKATLIKQLYVNCRNYLENKPRNQIQSIKHRKDDVLSTFDSKYHTVLRCLWRKLGNAYFLTHEVANIQWHMQEILAHDNALHVLVSVKTNAIDNITDVFIFMPDAANIFTTTVSVFDKFGLNVIDAQIFTSKDAYCLDTFRITNQHDDAIDDPELLQRLQHYLMSRLSQGQAPSYHRRPNRLLRHFNTRTQINFIQSKNKKTTVLEIFTQDFPGLLALLAKIFMEFKLNLVMAKITTLGERAEDVFYLTDKQQRAINDQRLQDQIKTRIIERINCFNR